MPCRMRHMYLSINCTKCKGGYYGPTYTHGCPEGQYLEKATAYCSNCPTNCISCNSSAYCVSCRPGNHGNTCEYSCPDHCEKCDQNEGNCLLCADGYFNNDKRCHSCPDGCVGCYDNKNCTACKEGYSKLQNGQCIMDCSREEDGTYLTPNGKNESDTLNTHSIIETCVGMKMPRKLCSKREHRALKACHAPRTTFVLLKMMIRAHAQHYLLMNVSTCATS